MDKWQKELADNLWQWGAFEFGDYTLASGVKSRIKINLRTRSAINPGPLTEKNLDTLADYFFSYISEHQLKFDRISGVPSAGSPIAKKVAEKLRRSGARRVETPYLPLEKTEKNGVIVVAGNVKYNDTILPIDDVLSTATRKGETLQALEQNYCKVTDILVAVDRCLGGKDLLENEGYCVHALIQLPDVLYHYADSWYINSLTYGALMEEIELMPNKM